MSLAEQYHVILSRPDSFDLAKLSEIMAPCLSLTPTDIILRLKYSWGFLHNTQDRDDALKLQEQLMQAGIETFIRTGAELKMIPAPQVYRKAIPEPQGLVVSKDDRETTHPWSSFQMICAAQVMETSTEKKRVVGDGKAARYIAQTGFTLLTAVRISHDRLKGKEKIEKRTSSSLILDLVARENNDCLRILGDKFDYSFLKERMGYNVLMNFKNLYMDISRFLPPLTKNRGAQALEANAMIKMRYTETSSYENEKLWLLQLQR